MPIITRVFSKNAKIRESADSLEVFDGTEKACFSKQPFDKVKWTTTGKTTTVTIVRKERIVLPKWFDYYTFTDDLERFNYSRIDNFKKRDCVFSSSKNPEVIFSYWRRFCGSPLPCFWLFECIPQKKNCYLGHGKSIESFEIVFVSDEFFATGEILAGFMKTILPYELMEEIAEHYKVQMESKFKGLTPRKVLEFYKSGHLLPTYCDSESQLHIIREDLIREKKTQAIFSAGINEILSDLNELVDSVLKV